MIDVQRYLTADGTDVIGEWLEGLRDSRARARIVARIGRVMAGNFGDARSLGRGLFELRINYGPGYRLYYAMLGPVCVLLLCGGDKRKQSADIERATVYLAQYKERNTYP